MSNAGQRVRSKISIFYHLQNFIYHSKRSFSPSLQLLFSFPLHGLTTVFPSTPYISHHSLKTGFHYHFPMMLLHSSVLLLPKQKKKDSLKPVFFRFTDVRFCWH